MITGKTSLSGSSWLWLGAFAVVASVHGSAGWALLGPTVPPVDSAPSGALVIELAAFAATREDVPTDVAPGPPQEQSIAAPDQPKRAEPAETETRPRTEPAVEPTPKLAAEPDATLPAQNKETKTEAAEAQPESQASLAAPVTSAPQVEAERKSTVATAAAQGAGRDRPSITVPRWSNRLVQAIEGCKRYPAAALAGREEGTTRLAFSLDRRGALVSVHIVTSSGSEILDSSALQIVKRCAPFAPPPDDVKGKHVPLNIAIKFRAPAAQR